MDQQRHTKQQRVLVVDDAPEYTELLVPLLEQDGYTVTAAADGDTALAMARQTAPDVVVLDVMLPGIDGMEVCRQLRTFSDAYVIMLTGRTDEIDRVIGLEVGADDYLTKPFSPRELQARVKAMLRRPRTTRDTPMPDTMTIGPLHIDVAGREARLDANTLALTKIEFDLLASLASDPGVVFSRARLRAEVWGTDWFGDDHVVDVHIANLRKKVHAASPERELIRTVRGVGYRLAPVD